MNELELYNQLSEEERFKLDTLILTTREEEANIAASEENTEARAIRAAGRVLSGLENPDDLREEEIENLMEFYTGTSAPDATPLEILQAALGEQRLTIDDRVRDGLQATDANADEIGATTYRNMQEDAQRQR